MRKILVILIIVIFCISMVSCNEIIDKNNQRNTIENSERKFEDLGVQFTFPKKWKDKERSIDIYGTLPEGNINGQVIISFIPNEIMEKAVNLNKESEKVPETDESRIKEISTELMDLTKEFKEICIIASVDRSKTEENIKQKLFEKYDNNDLLGEYGSFDFYLLYNNKPDISKLSESSKKEIEEIYVEIISFKSLINIFKPISEKEKLSKYNKLEFKSKTLDGKEIDNSIFKDSKITMVNIWATYCGPCIEEMPDIQKLYDDLKNDGINVVGIVSDTPDEDNEELAKTILFNKGVSFTNIIPDENINNILEDISGVPTTLFVDSNGEILGEFLTGANSKKEYQMEIQERLKNMK